MGNLKELTIKCKKDNEFEFNRNVEFSCGNLFTIGENDIFSVSMPDYFGDEKREYYAICPNCGYINLLDKSVLPEEIKVVADMESKIVPSQYRMNNLRSELIYLERVSSKKLTKTR